MGFIIKNLKKKMYNVYIQGDMEGYKYKFKSSSLGISELNILNQKIIISLISTNFTKKYKDLLEKYLLALNDADSSSSESPLMPILDEIARLKSIIIRKYSKVLQRKELTKFLNRLKILENEIRMKIIAIRVIKEREITQTINEKAKSR